MSSCIAAAPPHLPHKVREAVHLRARLPPKPVLLPTQRAHGGRDGKHADADGHVEGNGVDVVREGRPAEALAAGRAGGDVLEGGLQ